MRMRLLLTVALFGVLSALTTLSFSETRYFPLQSGCCSYHGGESGSCSIRGYQICNDGFDSPSCRCTPPPTTSPTFLLTVTKAGGGSGTVVSQGKTCDASGYCYNNYLPSWPGTPVTGVITGAEINCGSDCTEPYSSGASPVELVATPASGSVFKGWTGDCTNSSGSCRLNMTAPKNVTATFVRSLADLIVDSVTFTPAAVSVGGAVNVVATIANRGTLSSGVTWVGFYLSDDAIVGVNDINTHRGCEIPALAPGDKVTCNGSVTLPSEVVGVYFFGAIVDSSSVVPEGEEFNNSYAALTRLSIGSHGLNTFNFSGLWWKAPAGSESGWGINLAHQGDIIFATWFTYDNAGRALWLSMTANKTGEGAYAGTLYQTHGPEFGAAPFNSAAVTATAVGTGMLKFSDANLGAFVYVVNGITQGKLITRQVFGPLPTCTFGAQPNLALATNYQDLWWAAPAGAESGWGVNLTHQGDVIFATWFTYDGSGMPLWLSATINKTGPGIYTGTLYRTVGPPFHAEPFLPSNVSLTAVGPLTITFVNGNSARFAYSVNGVTQTKSIVRQVFRTPGTVCQ